MSEFSILLRRGAVNRPSERTPTHSASPCFFVVDNNSLVFRRDGFELSAKTESREGERIWLEKEVGPGESASFIVVFGWCHRIASDAPVLRSEDFGLILRSHRSHEIIDLDDLSGNYCLLSYDHLSDTMWCCSDLWAQQGYYFGASRELVAVGSRASWVADRLCASVDGYSYLTMLRGAPLLPGMTLYTGVHRLTCGLGLKIDLGNCTTWLVKIGDIWRPPLDISFKDALERCVDVITRVCIKAASLPHTAVDLTGGNDARLTAAVLSSPKGAEMGRAVTFKLTESDDSRDAAIARRIAAEFNWTLRRFDRSVETGITNTALDFLREVALLSDGHRFPYEWGSGLLAERANWAGHTHLLGSSSGELFRDRYWYQETLRMGRTEKVNYDAFRHTLSASDAVDFARVSQGRVSRQDHDDYLRAGYARIEEGAPSLLNVYKLDRISMHKLLFVNDHWRHSELRATHLPYRTAEVADVGMRVPWRYRVGRRLTTGVVERLSPRLARIPTDRGAPMQPLRVSTVGSYIRFHVWDTYDRWNRHFGPGRQRSDGTRSIGMLPRSWLDYVRGNKDVRGLDGCSSVLKDIAGGQPELSPAELRELQMLLLLGMLREAYPNLQLAMTFDRRESRATRTVTDL